MKNRATMITEKIKTIKFNHPEFQFSMKFKNTNFSSSIGLIHANIGKYRLKYEKNLNQKYFISIALTFDSLLPRVC